MASETTKTKSENGCETSGFPAEHKAEENDRASARGEGCSEHEDETHAQIGGEDEARFDGFEGHETASKEAVEGIQTLSGGEDIR